MPDSIGPRGSGFQTVRVNFCLSDSWEYIENQPVWHIYQWLAHPTHGGVCNHCERMMDGLRLDDIISGNREGSLTEDEIVEYVQSGGPQPSRLGRISLANDVPNQYISPETG